MPKLGPVPTGNWTGIKWIAIPGGHAPAVTADQARLLGSGRGYSEFIWSPSRRTLTPWLSPDGLTWKAGAKLDTSAWMSYFKNYDAATGGGSDPAAHDDCGFAATDFAEGSQTLLLRGYVVCGAPCGGAGSAAATWVSPDGISWTPTTTPDGLVSYEISGGSSGFVTLGTANSTTELWTSQDGRAWTKGSLPPDAVAPGASANTPVSIAEGFVLAGVVTVKKGHESGGGGVCGGGVNLTEHQAALWWSPDGTTWTRDSLSRATPTYLDISMDAHRIDDHTVVAIESLYSDTGTTTTIEWASNDGKSWTVLKGNPVDETAAWELRGAPCVSGGCIVEGRDRGLIYAWNSDHSAATVSAFDDRLALVALKQTGALPWWDKNVGLVMGPSGILASDGGTRFWIGVPTAG